MLYKFISQVELEVQQEYYGKYGNYHTGNSSIEIPQKIHLMSTDQFCSTQTRTSIFQDLRCNFFCT